MLKLPKTFLRDTLILLHWVLASVMFAVGRPLNLKFLNQFSKLASLRLLFMSSVS